MDRDNKLATNTRVRIIAMGVNSIRVETVEEIPQRHTIPRIRFKFRIPSIPSFHMTRMQFPLRLAYAVTINKSQGQSYDWVLVVLTLQCFAHGQAYVALSRSRYCDQTAIYGCPSIDDGISGIGACIQNVVYKDLLYNKEEHEKKKQDLLQKMQRGLVPHHHQEYVNVPDLPTLNALRAGLEGDLTEEARDHDLAAINVLEQDDELDEEIIVGDDIADTAEDDSFCFLSPPLPPPPAPPPSSHPSPLPLPSRRFTAAQMVSPPGVHAPRTVVRFQEDDGDYDCRDESEDDIESQHLL